MDSVVFGVWATRRRRLHISQMTWWLSRNLYLGSGIEDKFVVYSLSICQQLEHIPGKGNHKSRRGPDFPVEEGVFSTSSFRSLLLPSCNGGYNTTAALASDSTRFDAPSLSFPFHSERCPVDGSSNACWTPQNKEVRPIASFCLYAIPENADVEIVSPPRLKDTASIHQS
jgi:hypothetical protein